jgi:hypothetical protein
VTRPTLVLLLLLLLCCVYVRGLQCTGVGYCNNARQSEPRWQYWKNIQERCFRVDLEKA